MLKEFYESHKAKIHLALLIVIGLIAADTIGLLGSAIASTIGFSIVAVALYVGAWYNGLKALDEKLWRLVVAVVIAGAWALLGSAAGLWTIPLMVWDFVLMMIVFSVVAEIIRNREAFTSRLENVLHGRESPMQAARDGWSAGRGAVDRDYRGSQGTPPAGGDKTAA